MKPRKEPNPYDYFGVRRLESCGPHLEKINLPFTYNLENAVQKWIEMNCKKRYFIGKGIQLTNENSIESCVTVGFEDPKELSYFVLACPLLKYK